MTVASNYIVIQRIYPRLCGSLNYPKIKDRFGLPIIYIVSAEQRALDRAMAAGKTHEEYLPLLMGTNEKNRIFASILKDGLGDPIL